MSPEASRTIKPPPEGPGFPNEDPSTFNLRKEKRGNVQKTYFTGTRLGLNKMNPGERLIDRKQPTSTKV